MRAANVDTSQKPIVAALRQIGASVQILSTVGKGCPDLLVGWRGLNFLLECKTGADKLNQMQKDWHATWGGHVAVVRTPEEAQLAVIHGSSGKPAYLNGAGSAEGESRDRGRP